MLIDFFSFFFANSCKANDEFFTCRIHLLSYSTEMSYQEKGPGYKSIGPPITYLGLLVTTLKQQFNIPHLLF